MKASVEAMIAGTLAAAQWWIDGLWLGLPERIREQFFVPRERVTARYSGSTSIALTDTAARTIMFDLQEPNTIECVKQKFPHLDRADITVVLPTTIALTHTVVLPIAAEASLEEALRYEIDRVTPFSIEDVTFDYRVRSRTASTLTIDVALVRRAALAGALNALRRVGLEPVIVTVEGRDGDVLGMNLLPRRRRLRLPGLPPSFRPALVLGAAFALAAALYVPLARYDWILERSDASVKAERAAAVSAQTALQAKEASLERANFLAERRRRYVPPLELLRELTEHLPEHTWLTRLSITGTEVELRGESAAATELLPLIESLSSFERARFLAPVARADKSGREQFTIVAGVAGAMP